MFAEFSSRFHGNSIKINFIDAHEYRVSCTREFLSRIQLDTAENVIVRFHGLAAKKQ